MERYNEYGNPRFIEYEKSFNFMSTSSVKIALKSQGFPNPYTDTLKHMCENATTTHANYLKEVARCGDTILPKKFLEFQEFIYFFFYFFLHITFRALN